MFVEDELCFCLGEEVGLLGLMLQRLARPGGFRGWGRNLATWFRQEPWKALGSGPSLRPAASGSNAPARVVLLP